MQPWSGVPGRLAAGAIVEVVMENWCVQSGCGRLSAVGVRRAVAGAAFVVAVAIGGTASASNPGRLLVYYGYPSDINGASGDTALAAQQFANYDKVILGQNIELTTHEDHDNTASIIAQTPNYDTNGVTAFYGYIHLGPEPNGTHLCVWSTAEPNTSGPCIHDRAQAWIQMGAQGIFLDEFGFDYGNDRARQNDAVDAAHQAGATRVIANAWDPDDAFGGTPATHLTWSDMYFFESHIRDDGAWADPTAYMNKAEKLLNYRQQLGFGILSVTTDSQSGTYSAANFQVSWLAASIYDHEDTGWGEPDYSSDAEAPLRTVPPDLSQSFSGPREWVSPTYLRRPWGSCYAWVDLTNWTSGECG